MTRHRTLRWTTFLAMLVLSLNVVSCDRQSGKTGESEDNSSKDRLVPEVNGLRYSTDARPLDEIPDEPVSGLFRGEPVDVERVDCFFEGNGEDEDGVAMFVFSLGDKREIHFSVSTDDDSPYRMTADDNPLDQWTGIDTIGTLEKGAEKRDISGDWSLSFSFEEVEHDDGPNTIEGEIYMAFPGKDEKTPSMLVGQFETDNIAG